MAPRPRETKGRRQTGRQQPSRGTVAMFTSAAPSQKTSRRRRATGWILASGPYAARFLKRARGASRTTRHQRATRKEAPRLFLSSPLKRVVWRLDAQTDTSASEQSSQTCSEKRTSRYLVLEKEKKHTQVIVATQLCNRDLQGEYAESFSAASCNLSWLGSIVRRLNAYVIR